MSESKSKKVKARGVKLHPTAVARQLKYGALTSVEKRAERGGVRMTASAVNQAVEASERMLKELGAECQRMLQMARKKTVTKDCLLDCLKSSCHFLGAEAAVKGAYRPTARKGTREKPVRGARQPIAIASALKAFEKGIPLGKKAYRVSEEAKYALAELTRAYIVHLGRRAGDFANAGKRATITGDDVASARNCLN